MKKSSIVQSLILIGFVICSVNTTHAQTDIIVFGYDNAGNRTSRIIDSKDILVDSITLPDSAYAEAIMLSTDMDESQTGIFNIEVFPNPNNGVFYVKFNPAVDVSNTIILIETLIGTRILRLESVEYLNEFDISTHGAGIYFVTVISGDDIETWKIVKH